MRGPRYIVTALALLAAASLAGCAETGEDAGMAADTAAIDAAGDTAAVGDTAAAASGDALVNPNEADEDELRGLPGLDSATLALIVEQRPFDRMLDLDAALRPQMDSAALDGLYREMFIPIDLNDGTREEFLLIPGVGPRMAAEFLEYQPYEGGMAEFRQEIGKYVDEAEVARLERYVMIR